MSDCKLDIATRLRRLAEMVDTWMDLSGTIAGNVEKIAERIDGLSKGFAKLAEVVGKVTARLDAIERRVDVLETPPKERPD